MSYDRYIHGIYQAYDICPIGGIYQEYTYPYRFFLEKYRICLQTLNPKNKPKTLNPKLQTKKQIGEKSGISREKSGFAIEYTCHMTSRFLGYMPGIYFIRGIYHAI
jgi:hypothetical protein